MDENMKVYQNPLTGRYASREMSYNWSPQRKHSTWRRLWLALAESEKELGLPITDKQLAEMRAHLDDIDFEAAAAEEAKLRHDVMSHSALVRFTSSTMSMELTVVAYSKATQCCQLSLVLPITTTMPRLVK